MCEPAQSRWTSTFHRSHFYRESLQEKCRGPVRLSPECRHTLCASLRVETHVSFSQDPLYAEICRKNAASQNEPRARTHTLCEPAQSKCTSTFRKIHFLRKFTGKMPGPRVSKHPDEAPTFTLSVGTSQCGHTVWGKTVLITGLIS